MAQNIIYSPWEGTNGPSLCLMTTLLLFGPLFLFSFVSAFLISLIKLIIWPKFSRDKRQAEDMWGRTIGSCSVSKSDKNGECFHLFFLPNKLSSDSIHCLVPSPFFLWTGLRIFSLLEAELGKRVEDKRLSLVTIWMKVKNSLHP